MMEHWFRPEGSKSMIDRPPLLAAQPRGRIESLEVLIGLANAIEIEAVARYRQLAALMEERDDAASAAVFRALAAVEQRHVDMVAALARTLRLEVPAPLRFAGYLPPEISESWNDVQHSQLLTPYRALAVAVANQERTFALYSYIAANAENVAVAQQAEALAREELAHVAELRVQRRLAWRREFAPRVRIVSGSVETIEAFRALDRRLMGAAAAVHRSVAADLRAAGDAEDAMLVTALAQSEEAIAGARAMPTVVRQDSAPAALLREALRPLERASEAYEDVVVHTSQEALLQEALAALGRVVESIALLAQRLSWLG
jgi:rubrerythrin